MYYAIITSKDLIDKLSVFSVRSIPVSQVPVSQVEDGY